MLSIIHLLQVDHRELHLNSILKLNAYLLKFPSHLVGDFNIHFDDVTKSEPLRNLLDAFNLLEHVNSPTYKTGHTLDLVISSDSDILVSSVVVYPDLISDHHCIALTLNILKPSTETAAAFCDDIKSTCSTICGALVDGQHVDDLILTYNTCLSDCLDKHAPWRNVRRKSNSPHPQYDIKVDEARRKRRSCENVWRRTQLEIYHQIYIKAHDDCTTTIARKKTQHYCRQLQNTNNKDMFSILRSFDVQRLQLPEFCSMVDGCDTFSRFFQEKIDKLLVNLYRTTAVEPEPGKTPCFTASIEVFELTTTAKISNILGITSKACILDPLPTKQLSDNVESMVPSITYVTNASLENTVMSVLLKHAIVRPLLKKQSLNKDILSNYCTISNLSHLAKVIEKVVARKITLIYPNSECKIVSNQPTGRTIQQKQRCCV